MSVALQVVCLQLKGSLVIIYYYGHAVFKMFNVAT